MTANNPSPPTRLAVHDMCCLFPHSPIIDVTDGFIALVNLVQFVTLELICLYVIKIYVRFINKFDWLIIFLLRFCNTFFQGAMIFTKYNTLYVVCCLLFIVYLLTVFNAIICIKILYF